jgi:signal transduction histidine kinase
VSQADVDLAKSARSCLERLRPLAAQQGIRLRGDFAPARATCNRDNAERLISNLLTNAIYYNKLNGEVRLATFAEADFAVLTIADTGIGIPAADLPCIFDRFYRVDKCRSRREGHTGLGLAICKAIVDAARGTIEVASTPNEGTTFTVRLPRR